MTIAVCINNENIADLIKGLMSATLPDAQFEKYDARTLPYFSGTISMVLCDAESLLHIWQNDKLRAHYLPSNPIAMIVNINGKPEIFYKSYTSQGLRTLGMKRIGAEPSPMIPLFHSLAEITEDGKSDDYFLYTGGSSGGGQFAVRYGDDTLIAQYADNVKSGSRTIISVAGERRIGRLRLHKDGVSIEGKFYSYQECETLPLYIIARIQKVLKGRN